MGEFPKIFKEVERHMNKKVLSLVLALVIVLGSFGTVLAADPLSTQDQKIQWLIDNEVVAGRKVNADGSADLALDEFLTRAEVTKLIVYTLKLQNLADALKGVMQPFPDVALDHWANGYISVATTQRADVANGRRIVIGYPDGKFYPNNNVTYAELATMLVRIVKKDLTDAMEKNAIWATSYMRWAEEEGILKGLTIADSNKPVPRRDAFEMIYNAMFLLDKANYNAPKFGDVMGIVSKAQAGIIQLNQDSELEYKITFNSRVTDGTTWGSIAENSNLPGSLVRLIANEQGEILYIIELGSPRDGALETSRWFEVADKTAETRDFGGRDAVAGDAYFFDEYFKKIYVNGAEATIDSDTRFFVADVDNNALKEVKTLDEVFRYYIRDYKDLNKVYMGYDSFQGRNEAKVIVFGEVDKYMGGTAIRRVTNYYSTRYHIAAEDTKGAVQTYNLADTIYFPRSKYVDKLDVIKLYLDGDNYSQSERGSNKGLGYDLLIDYSAAPVYEVSAVNLGDRYIELKDEYGYARRFYIKDADVFLEGQAKKGAHVQVVLSLDETEVEIVSVVDKALEGALPTGVRVGMENGYIVNYEKLADGRMTVTIAETKLSNGEYRNLKTYEVATDWRAAVETLGKGARIVYDVNDKFGATPYIYNVEKWSDKGVQPGDGNLPRLLPVKVTGIAEGGNRDEGEFGKDEITLITGEWNKLPRYSEVRVNAPAAVAGKAFAGFEIKGNVTGYTENLTTREARFQMPRTGDVEIKAVYEDAKPAKITSACVEGLQVVSVNGYVLENPVYLPADKYVNAEGKEVDFLVGDKVVIVIDKEICESDECVLDKAIVTYLCGEEKEVEIKPIKIESQTPCGNPECYDCAIEVTLECVTDISLVGKKIVDETIGAHVIKLDECAGVNCAFEVSKVTALINGTWTEITGTTELEYAKVIKKEAKLEGSELVAYVTLQAKEGYKLIDDSDPANPKAVDTLEYRIVVADPYTACEDTCEFSESLDIEVQVPCKPCETSGVA